MPSDRSNSITSFLNACFFSKAQFTSTEVAAKTGMPGNDVGNFLLSHLGEYLSRTGARSKGRGCRYVYSVIKPLPPPRGSMVEVEKAIRWVFIIANLAGITLDKGYVLRKVNKTRKSPFSRCKVFTVISNFHSAGILHKIGEKYILSRNWNQRPVKKL